MEWFRNTSKIKELTETSFMSASAMHYLHYALIELPLDNGAMLAPDVQNVIDSR